MHAKDLMVTEFETIGAETPLLEAVDKMRRLKLVTGKNDVRCVVVVDAAGNAAHIVTEADIIRAILPWFFRERRFSDFVGKWLSKELPSASLVEIFADLSAGARKKTVKDLLGDTKLISVDEEDSILKIAYVMHMERIKSLPVLRQGKIIGIVFRTAVFEAIANEMLKGKARRSQALLEVPKEQPSS